MIITVINLGSGGLMVREVSIMIGGSPVEISDRQD